MQKAVTSYRDLTVWQKAMECTEVVYRATDKLPPHEVYGLASQMRRAAISIPANIAEGRRRGSRAEFRRFTQIAFGSGGELETHIDLMRRLYPATEDACDKMAEALTPIMKMLNTLISRLS